MHYNESTRGKFLVLADENGIYKIDKSIEENKILIDKINSSNLNHIQVVADEIGNITDILDIEIEEIEKIPTESEINRIVRKKINEKYDHSQEIQMLNKFIEDNQNAEYLDYKKYRDECINWGISEKEKYGIV